MQQDKRVEWRDKSEEVPNAARGEVLAVCSIQEYMVGSKYSHYTVMFTHNFLDLLWANEFDQQLRVVFIRRGTSSENKKIGRWSGAYILST